MLERMNEKISEEPWWVSMLAKPRLHTVEDDVESTRPKVRGDCVGGVRPCPWVGCRYNMYLDVGKTGNVKFNYDVEPHEVQNSLCALDHSNEPHTLAEIADMLGLTRERIRQLQDKALEQLKNSVQVRKRISAEDIRAPRSQMWDEMGE